MAGRRRTAPADGDRSVKYKGGGGAYLGWEGAKFPLSKLDLTTLTRDYGKIRHAPPPSSTRRRNPKGGVIVSPRLLQDHHRSRSSGKLKLVSQTEHGWSWLSVQFRELRGNKHLLKHSRKGELAPGLVDAIWGSSKNVRLCRQPLDSLKALGNKGSIAASRVDSDLELEIKKIRAKTQKKKLEVKSEDSLMDILLDNWTYFGHSHTTLGSTEKKIDAKYCENEFGHFLLADGQQIHGQFNIQLHVLVKKLKTLMQKLRSQILPTSYQELPSWRSPRLEDDPELEMPRMPPMPQLYPIEGLKPIPSEEDENIPNDYPAPVFKSPVPKEHPPLVLPEPLNVPPLKLPVMPVITDDESKIDYESYKEEPLPVFTLPFQEPLPTWVEPHFTELPPEPEYLSPPVIPVPIMQTIPTFRPPALDPRPCERSYYELGNDEKGICDGLCSKHGHKHHFVRGQHRREPCLAKPPPMLSLPLPPFPEAESFLKKVDDTEFQLENLRIVPEPQLELPSEVPIPPFQPPALMEEPAFVPLQPPPVPTWKPPQPPPPVGWLAGQRPVFLIDCSAAMAGDRMEAVQDCLKQLFSPGGQGDIAISHFDIIMYSFDAWSFGDIENSYAYKQTSGARYSRLLEPMRTKSEETVKTALSWVSRWRPAGVANLSKALETAASRFTADCIYLFSEGRADKPVLILESLKRRLQNPGGPDSSVVPIHTIAMKSSKMRSHFLKRLSTVTGGHFMEYGAAPHHRSGADRAAPSPAEPSDDDAEDMGWARREVEERQRICAASGVPARIPDILKEVEREFSVSRLKLRMEIYEQKVKHHEAAHREEVCRIQSANAAALLQATQAHEATVAETGERNRTNKEAAEATWRAAVAAAREENAKMARDLLSWREQTRKVVGHNERSLAAARERFAAEVREVEERNVERLLEAEEQHAAETERIRVKHKEAVEEAARRQKESDEKVAAMNRAAAEEHRAAVAAIRESNAATLSQAQLMFEERMARVKADNARILREAQTSFEARCEAVRAENARKKAALAEMLAEIRRRKEEAVAAHKADVMRTISEHEQMMKSYAAMNAENEEAVRREWAASCEAVDRENMAAAQSAVAEFEAERRRVQAENVRLAERRLELRRRAAEVAKENDEVVRKKKAEWKAACEAVEAAYEVEVAAAKAAHEAAVEEVKRRNAEKLQASLLEHKAKVAAAESYNETVRPYVEASGAVRAEVRRVEAFLQCVADSILPADRHIMEKKPSKSPLDKDLDLLAVSTATLTTEMLIDALRSAYGKNWRVGGSQKMSVAPKPLVGAGSRRSRFSGLIPIHPSRVPAHSCRDPDDDAAAAVSAGKPVRQR